MGTVNCFEEDGRITIANENSDTRRFTIEGSLFGYSEQIIATTNNRMIFVYDTRGVNISRIYFSGSPKGVTGDLIYGIKGREIIVYNKWGNEVKRFIKKGTGITEEEVSND